MAGLGAVGAFKPTANPFAGQVARNTLGFGEQSVAPGVVNPYGFQVQRNTTGFAPSPANAAPYPNSSLPGNAAQVTRNTTSFTPGSAGSSQPGAPPLTAAQQGLAELESDPGYASAANDATRAAQDAQSTRQAAVRSALMQFGGDLPSGFQDTYGDIDPATLAAAKANPFSQAAQNLQQFGQTQTQDRQAEAANGSIFSGQAPTDIGNENFNQGLDLYNLGNSFASAANQAIGQYAGVLDTNRGNLTDALFKAESNQQTNPAYTTTAAPKLAPATGGTGAPGTPRLALPAHIGGTFGPAPATKPVKITPKFTPSPQTARNAT